jgi:hypothetical protein
VLKVLGSKVSIDPSSKFLRVTLLVEEAEEGEGGEGTVLRRSNGEDL